MKSDSIKNYTRKTGVNKKFTCINPDDASASVPTDLYPLYFQHKSYVSDKQMTFLLFSGHIKNITCIFFIKVNRVACYNTYSANRC